MHVGAEASALTVRDVVERHGGEFWFERERVRHQAFFRFLLPLADAAGDSRRPNAAALHHDSRPEYYDFDLFRASDEPARAGRPAAGRAELHRVRHRDHRPGPVRRRRDHPDRRHAHRQRQAAAPGELRAAGRPAARPAGRRHRRSTASSPRWWPASRPSTAVLPAFHAFAQRHRAGGAQRRLRHALPAAEGGRHRRALRPAGARHAAAVGGGAPEPGDRTGWRRSPSGWASPSSAATPRWATPSSPPRSS